MELKLKFVFIDDAKYWRSILGGLVCAALTVALPMIAMTRGALQNINVLTWDERILINLAVVFGAITAGTAHKTAAHFPSTIKGKTTLPSNWKEALGLVKRTIVSHQAFLLLQTTVLLNTAAAVLCKRISATRIAGSSETELVVSTLGLLVFIGGGLLLGLSLIYKPDAANEKVVEATQARSGNGSGNGGGNGNGNGNGNGKVHQKTIDKTNDKETESNDITSEDSPETPQPESDSHPPGESKSGKVIAPPLVQYPELSAWLLIIGGISLVENVWMPLLSLPGIVVGMKWYLNGRSSAAMFAGDGEQLDISKARWKIVPYVY